MRRRQTWTYLACSFGMGVFSAFNNYTLTLWLSTFTSSYLLLGLLGNTRSFEGTLVSPVVGAWSDHLWLGRLGRRRPFILAGGLVSALLLALTPAVAAWRPPALLGFLAAGKPGLVPAVIAIFLFTLSFNAMGDIHEALMVDKTSTGERNRLSALRVVVGMAGQVLVLVFGFLFWKNAVPAWAFAFTGLVIAAGTLWTVLGVPEAPSLALPHSDGRGGSKGRVGTNSRQIASRRDDKLVAQPKRKESLPQRVGGGAGVGAALRFFRQYRGAAIFCAVAFAYWTGVNAVLPLISIYTKDILHASTGEAQLLPALLLLSTTLLALPMARLGDRLGKRRVMAGGYAIVIVAGLLVLVITTKQQGAAVFLLAGVGNAASQVLTVPLLADLVPRRAIGRATGMLAASGSVAAPLASLAGGHLADVFGPRAIFALMAVCVACAIALLACVPAGQPALTPVPSPNPGRGELSPGVRGLKTNAAMDR